MQSRDRWIRLLAVGGVAGQVIFTVGWLVGGWVQDVAYSSARHDISDLGALTARHPWVMLTAQGLGGALTIAFALGSLRPALDVAGRRGAIGPWLIALSLPGLDNVSDLFFRLDCRAADPGCTAAVSAASWHGQVHSIVGGVSAVITLAAPFVMLRRLRLSPGWRGLFWPTVAVGIALVAGFVAYAALGGQSGQGLTQRAIAIIACGWIATLAVQVVRVGVPAPAPVPA